MEDKIKDILNSLDIDETDDLLKKDMKFSIDKKTMKHIKKSVYLKAGLKRKRFTFKKVLISSMIAILVIMSSFYIVGFDNVVAYINRVFNFIPGYGILEDNEDDNNYNNKIQYVIYNTTSSENDDITFKLNNAIATKDSILVMFSTIKKNYSDDMLLKDKEEELKRFANDKPFKRNISLHVNGNKYSEYSGSTGGGGKEEISTFNYSLIPSDINLDNVYKLEYEDYNISLEFKLKKIQSFNNIEDIGSTDYNNDISITAVPTFSDKKLEVNLYSINNSRYHIDSYCKFTNRGYNGKDMNLETDSGIKNYIMPDSTWDGYGKFEFDIEPKDKSFILKIPYLLVNSSEDQNIDIKIPKDNEKITINKRIDFKDSSMIIVDVEKVTTDNSSEYGDIKMNIKYENKYDNIIMKGASFNRINYFGRLLGGGYSSLIDDNDILTTVWYALDKQDKGTLRLKVSNPSFYLIDEYMLKFNR